LSWLGGIAAPLPFHKDPPSLQPYPAVPAKPATKNSSTTRSSAPLFSRSSAFCSAFNPSSSRSREVFRALCNAISACSGRIPSARAACHPFVAPRNSLASISLRYIHAIAPTIIGGSSPSRSKRSRNSSAFFGCRVARRSASSHTVVVFSEMTSATTSSRRTCLRSPAYVPSLSNSVFSLIRSPLTNSARSSAAPFSNSMPCSFASAFAKPTAAAIRCSLSSLAPTSTTTAFSASNFASFMRWSSPEASSTSTVNGAGFSKYPAIPSTVSSRFFSPSFSIASASSRKTTCCGESIGNVCAWSNAACVSPRCAENRDTAQARAASGTYFSISSLRQRSRKYGSSPSSNSAATGLPFPSRSSNSSAGVRAINNSPSLPPPGAAQNPATFDPAPDRLPGKNSPRSPGLSWWPVHTRCETGSCPSDTALYPWPVPSTSLRISWSPASPSPAPRSSWPSTSSGTPAASPPGSTPSRAAPHRPRWRPKPHGKESSPGIHGSSPPSASARSGTCLFCFPAPAPRSHECFSAAHYCAPPCDTRNRTKPRSPPKEVRHSLPASCGQPLRQLHPAPRRHAQIIARSPEPPASLAPGIFHRLAKVQARLSGHADVARRRFPARLHHEARGTATLLERFAVHSSRQIRARTERHPVKHRYMNQVQRDLRVFLCIAHRRGYLRANLQQPR